MCTAISLNTNSHYFGRNLDLDMSYGEEVCVMPRRFPLEFRKTGKTDNHFALIGMATVVGGIPLFYDAVNEYGLAMAGLNFPENAFYEDEKPDMENVAPFEFIPWILSQCRTVADARKKLEKLNLVNITFSEKLPNSPLHWMICDKDESVVVEAMKDGLHIYDNPVGVLTNNPPFDYQLFNLNNYRSLQADNGENRLSRKIELNEYCRGLGGLGLPGDVSSMSRFVRASFGKLNSVCEENESSSVSQFFHLLASVSMVRGTCKAESGKWDITVYSSCMNTDKGLYYYTTYDNSRITCIDMHKENLDGKEICRFPLRLKEEIFFEN